MQHKRVQLFFLKCKLNVFSCARFHFISLFWNSFSCVFFLSFFSFFFFLSSSSANDDFLTNSKRNGLKRHQLMCVYLFIYSISVARVRDGSSDRFPVNFVR